MSVLFQTLINGGKLYYFRKTFYPSYALCKCFFVRKKTDACRFSSFDEIVSQRRVQARRSVIVQVNSDSSFNELYGYCTKYAELNGIHHYRNAGDEHFMLIEFQSEENLKNALLSCGTHQKDHDVLSLQTPFLWFRANHGKKSKITIPYSQSLLSKNGNAHIDRDKLFEELMKCENVTSQIQLLYENTTLNDLGVRLRYMVARQLEVILESLYSNIAVRPFGSSVNGFGRMGCDLDLVLSNDLSEEMTDPSKRLVYQEKKCEGGRSTWQRHMDLVGEILELRVPGAARVIRILNARVPIVKYTHEYTNVDCDLCYNNMSGVYMSELLWLYGSLDPRVRPLAFSVRQWAAAAELTSPHPGRWITNFPLTLMVLFFLMQKKILPSFKYLQSKATKEDARIAEENKNCTFLRDFNKLPEDSYGQNNDDLGTLLLQFFEYYAQFDFQENAISINEGKPIRKPNTLPLYIVNPLETALNVSRNVSYEECERLKVEVRNAAWQLESSLEGERSEDWGLLGIVEKRTTRSLKRLLRVGNSHRLVSVKDLFNDNDEKNEEGLKSKLQRLTRKNDVDVEKSVKEMKEAMVKEERKEQKKFKSNQVLNEVMRIRRNKMV